MATRHDLPSTATAQAETKTLDTGQARRALLGAAGHHADNAGFGLDPTI
ncbi:hypothetical protein GCM10009801_10810 [Streptomyces albiaxialis]|uniref:Uncharacterized protein n=1 Tax=Streptomyces albiaxialis TaxID=329523 RepID=A0ABN2VLR5_9ACTN